MKELSEAWGSLIQNPSPATLHSLTSFPYVVQAVATAQNALYGELPLGNRISDTPLRRFIPRFKVHREPQVDDDKRTDIEVSSAAGKVCIEIKPVDSHRSYSANSLTQALREQLVGQYLRGQNSKHGVLVIFRLDDKKWETPGGPERGDFNELVEYLTEQAAKIESQSTAVESLKVIGIDCVPAKPPMP
jgi:hypothetical protein